jgi:hypothetical protein
MRAWTTAKIRNRRWPLRQDDTAIIALLPIAMPILQEGERKCHVQQEGKNQATRLNDSNEAKK